MEYILIFISAIFVNNIVLSQFLGICLFWEFPRDRNRNGHECCGSICAYYSYHSHVSDQKFVLDAFGLAYLQTITFILVIAALVRWWELY